MPPGLLTEPLPALAEVPSGPTGAAPAAAPLAAPVSGLAPRRLTSATPPARAPVPAHLAARAATSPAPAARVATGTLWGTAVASTPVGTRRERATAGDITRRARSERPPAAPDESRHAPPLATAIAAPAGAAGGGMGLAVLAAIFSFLCLQVAGALLAGVGLPRLRPRAARLERPG